MAEAESPLRPLPGTPTGSIDVVHVALSAYADNVGASTARDTGSGRFNVWGNSFAAEHLPGPGPVEVGGVSFAFLPVGSGEPDNVRCAGQYVEVPRGAYDWIHVLAAAERRAEDELALHFADGEVDFEPLRISDFWAAPPAFGERLAFESPVMHYPHHVQRDVPAMLWEQRVPVTRRVDLVGLRLPRNVAVHVFAITLLGGAG
jgi:hypothetical protein